MSNDWGDDIDDFNSRHQLPIAQKPRPKKRPTEEQRMSGKRSKRKGDRGEREALKELGDHARRGFGDRVSGDLRIVHGAMEGKVEVKREANPFPRAYRLIEGHRAVMFRADQKAPGEPSPEWLVTIRAKDFKVLLDLARKSEEV